MSHSLADLLPTDGAPLGLRLWLKSAAYTRRLLLGEAGDPWEGAAQYLAWFSQAHGLLKPDVAVIEVGELFASWLQRHPALRGELAGKRKLSYPLRKLLEQAAPRALLAEVVEAVLAHLRGQTPLVLAMPSPRAWLQQASSAAGREGCDFDADSIEDAAMYVADLVRSVSASAVGGLLLEESSADGIPGPVDVERYLPLINVAKHYRWPLALRLNGEEAIGCPALQAIDVVIGGQGGNGGQGSNGVLAAGRAHGVDVSAPLWAGQPVPAPARGQFHFIEVPRDAMPEHVLDSLARLRAGAA